MVKREIPFYRYSCSDVRKKSKLLNEMKKHVEIERSMVILDRKMYDIYNDFMTKSVNCTIYKAIKLLEYLGFDIKISKKGSHIKLLISSINDNKIEKISLIFVDGDFLYYYESVRVNDLINKYFIVIC